MAQKKASSSKRSSSKKTAGRKKTSGASKYVREEMREQKKTGSRSPKQAIAIGLSRARRAGEDVPAPKKGTSAATRKKAKQNTAKGRKKAGTKKTAARKSAAKKRGSRKSARKR